MTKTALASAACLANLLLVACGDSGKNDEGATTSTGGQTGGSSSTQGGENATGGTSGGAANPTGGTPSGTLFTDDFESGSAKWTIKQGACSIVADGTNVLHCEQGTNEARALAGDLTWGDYTVTARIKPIVLGAGKRVHLAARYTDSNNWYGAAFYNSSPVAIEIRKKVAGTSSTLATSTYPWVAATTWYKVAFKVSGTTLSMSIDDVTQLTIDDAQFASGQIAFLADQSEASIDDVVVTNP
jgi:pectate lyase